MLANTLTRIMENGYMDFYTGDLARDIVADIQDEGDNSKYMYRI